MIEYQHTSKTNKAFRDVSFLISTSLWFSLRLLSSTEKKNNTRQSLVENFRNLAIENLRIQVTSHSEAVEAVEMDALGDVELAGIGFAI